MNHLSYNFKRWWDTGNKIAIDQKTIEFQGNHKYKLCITYKSIVYGFQAYDIYEEVYTYAFIYVMTPFQELDIMAYVPYMNWWFT